MRTQRLASILSIIALSGCAAHRGPAATVPTPQPSSDWSAVRALPKGTFILLALENVENKDVRRAWVWEATDTTLKIREADRSTTIPRDQVARISVQDQIDTKRAPWYIRVPVVSAVLGGLAGLVGGAVAGDRDVVQAAAWTTGIGILVGVVSGPMDYPRPVYAVRPVYVRPVTNTR